MNSKKKSNRTLYLIITLVVLVTTRVILTFSTKEELPSEELKINVTQVSPPQVSSPASSAQELKQMEDDCTGIRSKYSDLNEVVKKHKLDIVFLNIHKEIDHKVYRLRFFYKDGDNSQIPTYLVYEEDDNEDELIVENTSHKKGPLFKKIEAAKGTILFTGSAYDLIGDQETYLYYENDVLKDLQGKFDLPVAGPTHLECRY